MSKHRKTNLVMSVRPNNARRARLNLAAMIAVLVLAVFGLGAFLNFRSPIVQRSERSRAATLSSSTPEYAANKPAKEYIYAGSKLVAVEEPTRPVASDLAVFRPSTGQWWVRKLNGSTTGATFGASADIPIPGDYDGDGKTDYAVFRPSDNTWYTLSSGNNEAMVVYGPYGASGDKPVPADYTGDGRTDLAVFRPSNSTWYLYDTVFGEIGAFQIGASGDVPVPADYDGDKKVDMAVWRDSNATWYVYKSTNATWQIQAWGASGDKPVPGDYDGDGKADFAGWQSSGIWNIRSSATGTALPYTQWGYQTSDIAVQADYDADGKTDLAVWRPSEGQWYVLGTAVGWFQVIWGQNGDIPVPGPFQR